MNLVLAMRVELLDDQGLPWRDLDVTPCGASAAEDIESWFSAWASRWTSPIDRHTHGDAIVLINAHGCFTFGAHRQDLQGVEILKHIRLSPWLGQVRNSHAIVYSFEPLEHILARRPGDLILVSPGVTFLRLPEALNLKEALCRAYPLDAGMWAEMNVREVLGAVAKNKRASPGDRGFRPFVACDYTPPDSAHEISNWWGVYEMHRALSGNDFIEYSQQSMLPKPVRDYVRRLDTKKALWLEGGSGQPSKHENSDRERLSATVDRLERAAVGRTVVYVDDEADKGWDAILGSLVNGSTASCVLRTFAKPELRLWPNGVPYRAGEQKPREYTAAIKKLVKQIKQAKPDVLILDMRLLGRLELNESPQRASGMDVARAMRSNRPHLPILLFTASNKAETLVISNSLDIDAYWMKPGLGDHSGQRGAIAELIELAAKLTALLDHDYAWLQRASQHVRTIKDATTLWWWEKPVLWPSDDFQRPVEGVRQKVVALLEPILYTLRMVIRLEEMFGGEPEADDSAAVSGYEPPTLVTTRLRAGLFNQIGQIVELVHRYPKNNGVIGGASDETRQYQFRRCDWWAFRLFVYRNKASHIVPITTRFRGGAVLKAVDGDAAAVDVAQLVISDLLAWLMIDRSAVDPIDTPSALTLVGAQVSAVGTRPFFRMHPKDAAGMLAPGIMTREIGRDDPLHPEFREQLAWRPAFAPLVQKSEELLTGRSLNA